MSTLVVQCFLNETVNILFKKYKLLSDDVQKVILELQSNLSICDFDINTQLEASRIKQHYKLQFYDSLIIATAIQANCTILYSEDMQHNQIIETIKIINPFV